MWHCVCAACAPSCRFRRERALAPNQGRLKCPPVLEQSHRGGGGVGGWERGVGAWQTSAGRGPGRLHVQKASVAPNVRTVILLLTPRACLPSVPPLIELVCRASARQGLRSKLPLSNWLGDLRGLAAASARSHQHSAGRSTRRKAAGRLSTHRHSAVKCGVRCESKRECFGPFGLPEPRAPRARRLRLHWCCWLRAGADTLSESSRGAPFVCDSGPPARPRARAHLLAPRAPRALSALLGLPELAEHGRRRQGKEPRRS